MVMDAAHRPVKVGRILLAFAVVVEVSANGFDYVAGIARCGSLVIVVVPARLEILLWLWHGSPYGSGWVAIALSRSVKDAIAPAVIVIAKRSQNIPGPGNARSVAVVPNAFVRLWSGFLCHIFAGEAGVTVAESKTFIQRFNHRYSQVFEYLKQQKREAIARGYVSSILGRRRYFIFESYTLR